MSYELRSRLGSLWSLCGSVVRASERGIRRSEVRFLGTFSLSLLVTRRKNILRSQWADFYCGSNSSADSEMTAFDGRIVHNRINGFTICHGIFRTGFVRTPLPDFSTHQENKVPSRWRQFSLRNARGAFFSNLKYNQFNSSAYCQSAGKLVSLTT